MGKILPRTVTRRVGAGGPGARSWTFCASLRDRQLDPRPHIRSHSTVTAKMIQSHRCHESLSTSRFLLMLLSLSPPPDPSSSYAFSSSPSPALFPYLSDTSLIGLGLQPYASKTRPATPALWRRSGETALTPQRTGMTPSVSPIPGHLFLPTRCGRVHPRRPPSTPCRDHAHSLSLADDAHSCLAPLGCFCALP